MRFPKYQTLTAIALGLSLAVGTGAAWSGPPGDRQDRSEANFDRMVEALKLTPEQQTQVRTILQEQRTEADRLRAQTRQRIDAVLTDAQRAQRDARMQQGLDRRLERMTQRLKLSADQTTQIRAIFMERQSNPDLTREDIKERIAAVLTPEQRKQFDSKGPRGERADGKGRAPEADNPPDETQNDPLGGPDGGPDLER
ncbi:Spy/CpxP family protein refolding chaperone [uncultured Lamprocystis sp.]|jgi:Spy/CpxP family protein refolding chaperone|uniref:Spy/CpxP family protein refolding chaperone n=1 Tax=uncultured Lamprocystis sp. TaxID=543132 RepID=UPI0026003C71|nr:Spy/CpxP family protein refolding chaperone [uncultured Lamprocystis sp.]